MLEAAVTKKLRDFTLDVSIRAGPGEIVALMGENGAGKSSVLNLIAGLMTPDTGLVRLGGSTLFDAQAKIDVPVEDRRIGYVNQNAAVFPHLTVVENVAFGLRAWHTPRDQVDSQVAHWMERMNISDFGLVRAGELSGGQKQRVALARAFAINPRLLLLDEPLTALDPKTQIQVRKELKEILAGAKIPVIIATHDVRDAISLTDRIYLIEWGKDVLSGNVDTIIHKGQNPFFDHFSDWKNSR